MSLGTARKRLRRGSSGFEHGAAAIVATTLERVVRESYGRLVAALVRRWGDLEMAEDAISEALAAALRDWPRSGVPGSPEGWLLQVARRRAVDGMRRGQAQRRAYDQLGERAFVTAEVEDDDDLGDERLELMMLCAHPCLEAEVRVPLMLQAVLGLSAWRLAAGFAVSASTLSGRLVRAKKRIRANRIRFHLDDQFEWAARFDTVLDSLYLAFSLEGDVLGEPRAQSMRSEIASLLELLLRRRPDHAEALGLVALVGFQSAREAARLSLEGKWVAFFEQDPGLWDTRLVRRAEARLTRAYALGSPGRYQLEAAIESALMDGRRKGRGLARRSGALP